MNFVDKITSFQVNRSHGHTCDRDQFGKTNQGRHSTGIVPAQFDPNIAARNLLYIKRLGVKAARAAMFYRS